MTDRFASQVDPEPISWSYEGYLLRRSVTLVAGSYNAGKSLVSLWFAKELSLRGQHVWLNGEDPLASVVRPRLAVAGATLDRVRITKEPFKFPRDVEEFEKHIVAHIEEGSPDDLVILDSLQLHVPRYQTASEAVAALEGLGRVAEDYELSILVVAHFVKNKGGSVEMAIGGAGAIQAQAKGVFVVGPAADAREAKIRHLLDPEAETEGTIALACVRIGFADPPDTMVFERRTARYEPTDRDEMFVEMIGTSALNSLSAADVLEAARATQRGPREDETKIVKAVEFLHEALSQGPRPTKDIEAEAKAAGCYFSRNTFDRARSWLHVRSIAPIDLRAELGTTAYSALSDDQKICWWAGLPHSPKDTTSGGAGGLQGGN